MDVISGRSGSGLNPNAPLFVPWAYRAVEDFSDQWWELVHSSPWFRDYWLQECFQEPQIDDDDDDLEPDLPIFDPLFDAYTYTHKQAREGEEERGAKDLVSVGAIKWRKPRLQAELRRYADKAPKIVSVKVSPRPIQQPR